MSSSPVPKQTRAAHSRSTKFDRNFYEIVKKYIDLRPKNWQTNRFFVGYRHGNCVNQPAGINKMYEQSKIVSRFMNLSGSNNDYTLRRSVCPMLANQGASVIELKKSDGWSSNKVAHSYVAHSVLSKRNIGSLISRAVTRQEESERKIRTWFCFINTTFYQTSADPTSYIVEQNFWTFLGLELLSKRGPKQLFSFFLYLLTLEIPTFVNALEIPNGTKISHGQIFKLWNSFNATCTTDSYNKYSRL